MAGTRARLQNARQAARFWAATTGGFAGSNFGSIYLSHATGNVTAGYTVGGFVGSSGVGSTMENCYATGNVVQCAQQRHVFRRLCGRDFGKSEKLRKHGHADPGLEL
ncbi:MAG: GLUG motif-containing protein [Christensenellales bacterium]